MLKLVKFDFPLVLFAPIFKGEVYVYAPNKLDQQIIFHSKKELMEGMYVNDTSFLFLMDKNNNIYEPIEYASHDYLIHDMYEDQKMSVAQIITLMML